MSDREKAGLRGPAKTVSQGSTKAEYDPAGRLIASRWLSNPSPETSETIETRTYDNSGHLLSNTVRDKSGILAEKVYSYDDKGRFLAIVERSGDRTSFQYDEQGRKIEIRDVSEKPDDRTGGMATGIDLMFADTEGTEFGWDGIRNASRIKTIYDEHDRPTETQALGADGFVVSRIVRSYDEKQRIVEMRVINEDPMALFSAEQKTEMLAQSNVPLDELKAHMKKAFDAMMGASGGVGRSYTYDSQGRRTKVVLHQGFADITRTSSYNDNGDVVEERTTFIHDPKIPVGVPFHLDEHGNLSSDKPPSEWPPQQDWPESVVRYKYHYDGYGNWTEQTVSRSDGPEYTVSRELTYH